MKKVILIAVNARYSHSNLALLYLKKYTEDLPYQVVIREFTIHQKSSEIAEAVAAEKPDAAAFSVYIWNSVKVRETVFALKALRPSCIIILGGPEVSYCAGTWLQSLPADFVVSGGGEEGFRRLLMNNLESGEQTIISRNPPFSDIPMPYTEEIMPLYKNRYLYYEASRGCPFKCTYCISSLADQKLELREIGKVKEELSFLAGHDPGIIKFVDRSFNAARGHSREIWRFLIRNYSAGKTLFHFELHPGLIDEEDFDILAESREGLFQFEIGIQSTNRDTLAEIRRVQDNELAIRNIRKLISMGKFRIHLDLIAGLPLEEMNSMEQSFNETYSMRPDYLQLGFLKLLPGTEMERRSAGYGMKSDDLPPYRVRETRWLSAVEMERLDGIEHLVSALYNSHGFETALHELERIHESPFAFYRECSLFAARSSLDIRGWAACGKLLIQYTESQFPDHAPFIRDCLIWDWCLNFAPRRIPGICRTGEMKRARRKLFLNISEPGNRGILNYHGISIKEADLKRAIVVSPESGHFREKYIEGEEMAIFMPGGRRLLISIQGRDEGGSVSQNDPSSPEGFMRNRG